MLDQSFSYENLKEIYDTEKRKGYSLDEKFALKDEITISNTAIKDIYKEIKKINFEFRKPLTEKEKEVLNIEKAKYEINLKHAKEIKNNLLKKEIEKICDEINSPTFSISVTKEKNFLEPSKPFYSIEDTLRGFLFKKHIQGVLNRLYKIKQSNRYLVVNQISEILTNNKTSLFNIIKLDIKKFYETIDLKSLQDKLIRDDNLLSPKIKNHITEILSQYKNLSSSDTGLPRGIGLSAYLGELYMRDFDAKIKKDKSIFFYARYVDDIIIITSNNYLLNLDLIINELGILGLELNTSKDFNLRDSSCVVNTFDYLGYSFTFVDKGTKNEALDIDISEKRLIRYKEKIDIAFDSYIKTSSYGRKANKNLYLRIKFLVSNIRLTGSKNNIVSGIYYSNKLLLEVSPKIKILDKYLKSKLKLLSSKALQNKLKQFSFSKGFDRKDKNFFFLKKNEVGKNKESKQLENLLKIWKYVK